jgi:Holliday junction resolvasome RuvABC endonuclease subunit
VLEDVAMSAHSRSIITLTLLNGYVRAVCDYLGVDYITVPPTQWKKEMLGNGQADKDLTVYHWKRLQPQFNDLEIKVDDLGDSYFLSHYV